MKNINFVLLVVSLFTAIPAASAADSGAQVFRSVDAQGNVTFSDTPRTGAQRLDIPAAPTMGVVTPNAPAAAAVVAPGAQNAFTGYQALVITQPADGAAFNNGAGDVDVSVNLVPALRTDLGHGLSLTMDGKPVLQNSTRMNVALVDVDRGEHVLEAFVVDASGQVVFQSAPVRFSLQRTSLFLPGRAGQVPPGGGVTPRPIVPTPRSSP
jgi:hypothetical protein